MSRRQLLVSLPALAMAPRALAQTTSSAPIRVRALNHMTFAVSDPKRSIEFYQGLFGMPIQARQGATTLLRMGSGPQFLAVSAAGDAPPAINHFCLSVDGFNVDRILKALADRGVTRSDTAGASNGGGGGSNAGPMKARVRMRGPDAGGAKEGTPELYFGDPDGIVVQLQDASYCGGAGALGNICPASPEPSPKKGLLAVRDLSHFTIGVSNAERSNAFYQDLFGLSVRAHQGPAPLLGVGPGVQFVMFTAPPRPPKIDHVCMNMDGFDPDKILKTLESYGIKPRGTTPGAAAPLTSYVSMRLENRGGAPGGTPELYFTDPDGLLVQLQDASYCGGSGYLGSVCR